MPNLKWLYLIKFLYYSSVLFSSQMEVTFWTALVHIRDNNIVKSTATFELEYIF